MSVRISSMIGGDEAFKAIREGTMPDSTEALLDRVLEREFRELQGETINLDYVTCYPPMRTREISPLALVSSEKDWLRTKLGAAVPTRLGYRAWVISLIRGDESALVATQLILIYRVFEQRISSQSSQGSADAEAIGQWIQSWKEDRSNVKGQIFEELVRHMIQWAIEIGNARGSSILRPMSAGNAKDLLEDIVETVFDWEESKRVLSTFSS